MKEIKFDHSKDKMSEVLGMSKEEYERMFTEVREDDVNPLEELLREKIQNKNSIKSFLVKCTSLIIEVLDGEATPATLKALNLIPPRPSHLTEMLTAYFPLREAILITGGVVSAIERFEARQLLEKIKRTTGEGFERLN